MNIGIKIEKRAQSSLDSQILGVQLAYKHDEVQTQSIGINGVYIGKDSQSQFAGIQLAHKLGMRENDNTIPHCMQDQAFGIQYVSRMPNGGVQSGLSINLIGNASGKERQEGIINIVFTGKPIPQYGFLNLGPGLRISFLSNALYLKQSLVDIINT